MVLRGEVRCWVLGSDDVEVDETFQVEVRVPAAFPNGLPRVYEVDGRILRDFHRLEDAALCLGSNTAQRLAMGDDLTLSAFVRQVVIPYLYAFLRFESTGRMPFGELAHGAAGLEEEVRRIFGMPPTADALAVLVLAAQHRRVANKRSCPCGSGHRLGRCHAARVTLLREKLGRTWFRREAQQLRLQRSAEGLSTWRSAQPRWIRRG